MRFLILVLALCGTAQAEKQFYYFTDGESCPSCVVLERNLNDERVKNIPIVKNRVDIRKQSREVMQAWKVRGWPTLFMVETTTMRVLKRYDGALSPEDLVVFLTKE